VRRTGDRRIQGEPSTHGTPLTGGAAPGASCCAVCAPRAPTPRGLAP